MEETIEIVRCFLFLFHVFGMVAGKFLLIVTSYVHAEGSAFKDIMHDKLSTPSWALFGIGIFVIIISCYGYCGAMQYNRCKLITYLVLLSLLIIIEVVFTILALVYRSNIEAETELTKQFNDYDNHKQTLDSIQLQLHCCGTDGPDSWSTTLPSSCCGKSDTCTKDNAYKDGCIKKTTRAVRAELAHICIVAFIAIFIKCVALVLCIYMMYQMKEERPRGYETG